MRRYLSLLLAAALILGGVVACSRAMGSPMRGGGADGSVQVKVENQNWSDMRIYVVRGGERRRLGSVTTFTSRTFTVPESFLQASGQVRLLARGLASGETETTRPILVNPGDVVTWNLKNDLSLSDYHVS